MHPHPNQERKFKGIYIEADMWLTKELSITEKVLLAEIDSFDTFFGSNEYLANFFDRTPKYMSKVISQLVDRGYLKRFLTALCTD